MTYPQTYGSKDFGINILGNLNFPIRHVLSWFDVESSAPITCVMYLKRSIQVTGGKKGWKEHLTWLPELWMSGRRVKVTKDNPFCFLLKMNLFLWQSFDSSLFLLKFKHTLLLFDHPFFVSVLWGSLTLEIWKERNVNTDFSSWITNEANISFLLLQNIIVSIKMIYHTSYPFFKSLVDIQHEARTFLRVYQKVQNTLSASSSSSLLNFSFFPSSSEFEKRGEF